MNKKITSGPRLHRPELKIIEVYKMRRGESIKKSFDRAKRDDRLSPNVFI